MAAEAAAALSAGRCSPSPKGGPVAGGQAAGGEALLRCSSMTGAGGGLLPVGRRSTL